MNIKDQIVRLLTSKKHGMFIADISIAINEKPNKIGVCISKETATFRVKKVLVYVDGKTYKSKYILFVDLHPHLSAHVQGYKY
jgi:hypothetical protein